MVSAVLQRNFLYWPVLHLLQHIFVTFIGVGSALSGLAQAVTLKHGRNLLPESRRQRLGI
jgi:hypothetical protein